MSWSKPSKKQRRVTFLTWCIRNGFQVESCTQALNHMGLTFQGLKIKNPVRTEPEDHEFSNRLDRIANLISYEQPLDSAGPLEVVAAQLRMEWNR